MSAIKTLVVISNQSMLSQFEWYYSSNSNDKYDAVVVNFDNSELVSIMCTRCQKCGLFDNVYIYDNLLSKNGIISKVVLMIKYIVLNITGRKRKYDLELVKKTTGNVDYQRVIVPSNYITFCTAAINAFPEAEIVCMEDGLSDYGEFVNEIKKFSFDFILKFVLAKLDVLNYHCDGYRFIMKNDSRMIKYCSLPEKMKYRGYKEIRELFKGSGKKTNCHIESKKYDVIVFSTKYDGWMSDTSECYNMLHQWLTNNYEDKSILIKKHPREKTDYLWDEPNMEVYTGDLSGEELLDCLPHCEVILLYTSALLLKLCKENRNFKIVRMNNITNNTYFSGMINDADVVGLNKNVWIDLGDNE